MEATTIKQSKSKEREAPRSGAMWNTLGQAATVAQLVGADVGGLISMIIQAAVTAQQNKKECDQLARRVFTIGELLQHLQDPEVLRRPELQRPLAELGSTLREAQKLVIACQDKSTVYRLVVARRQAERFRDVQSRIDSYLLLFPVISHLDITRRLERIYNVLVSKDTAVEPSAPAFSLPSEAGARIDWKEEPQVQQFTFEELANVTNNFAADKKIGKGGFSTVYRGWLPDGRDVAIKRMNPESSLPEMRECFNAEVAILRSVNHKNIVRLFGYCAPQVKRRFFRKYCENEMVIVYEYLENRSLELHLYDHWDSVVGTFGFLAPEYAMTGSLNLTTDVYSFGVVMLQVLTGKRAHSVGAKWEENKKDACEEEKREVRVEVEREACEELEQWGTLVEFAVPRIEAGELWKVLDMRPAAKPTPRQLDAVELVAQAAVCCVQLDWEARPSISEVVATLEAALELARADG